MPACLLSSSSTSTMIPYSAHLPHHQVGQEDDLLRDGQHERPKRRDVHLHVQVLIIWNPTLENAHNQEDG